MVNQIEEETGSLPENLPRGVPPEVASANPDVQAIIAPRLTMLMEIANSFLLTIIDSMESVPYGIRWICKQIRSLTRVRLDLFTIRSITQINIARYSANTPRQRTTQSARWLADFSSFGSLTLPLSRLRHTCLLMACQRSSLGERSPW